MRAQVGESRRRHVVDDIDMFRMQSYEEEEPKQGTKLAAQSKESSHYAINYEYRSRDEVANAMLKLQGKGKQAGYVSRAQAQRPKLQDVSWVLSKEGREAAVFGGAVTQSHSSRTGSDRSMARSFVSMSDEKSSKEAREPAVTADDVDSSRTGPVLQQEYSIKPSKNNMSVARSFVTTNLASRAATVVEAGEQAVSDNVQRHSLIEPKLTKPAYIGNNRSKKTKKKDGILKSLFRCGMCATETQLPDFSVLEVVKEYSVDEGLANHAQGLKIETSSQFLSPPPPPPPSAYIHVAPCDVVHHSESIDGCSTITHSVAGKLVVRDEPEEIHSFAGKLAVRDEPEVIRDNAATTKHSNMSSCASSLMDRDNKDEHVVSKIPSVQDPSHEQMSDAEYESLGLGSKGTYTQHYSASKSDSVSFMSVAGKGSSMGLSSAELGTRTQSQSFSLSLRDQDSNTFSSASVDASEEDSDYTLTDGSSSALSSIGDSFVLSSYSSTMQEDDSMTYGPSLSGSSSDSYGESRYD